MKATSNNIVLNNDSFASLAGHRKWKPKFEKLSGHAPRAPFEYGVRV